MKRHAFDLFSFLSGLFFVTVALVALAGGISLDVRFDLQWVVPALLIGAGIALLASIASTRRRTSAAEADLAAASASQVPATDPWLADDDLAATVEEVDAAREANSTDAEDTAVLGEDEGREG